MSTKVSTWVWHSDHTQHVRATQLIVLLALADIADDQGNVVFVDDESGTQEALARKTRMSVSSFRRITGELRDAELLEITRASQVAANRYRIRVTAQSDLWKTLTGQNERSNRALTVERSDRSTVSGLKEARSYVFNPPNPPQSGGNRIIPSEKVVAKLAAAGILIASDEFRICARHRRQRSSCLECFTPRKLTTADVPWCGDPDCDEVNRQRVAGDVVTRCPECNPRALTDVQIAEIVGTAA